MPGPLLASTAPGLALGGGLARLRGIFEASALDGHATASMRLHNDCTGNEK